MQNLSKKLLIIRRMFPFKSEILLMMIKCQITFIEKFDDEYKGLFSSQELKLDNKIKVGEKVYFLAPKNV